MSAKSIKSIKIEKKKQEPQPNTNTNTNIQLQIEKIQLMWFEKYRPKTLDELCIDPAILKTIESWFNDYENHTEKFRSLLFIGPPGVGKTSIARILFKKYGYQIKEFNASDIRSKSLIH